MNIDPDALYTVDQSARKLMELKPDLTFEEAHRQVCEAIDSGALKPTGYLVAPLPSDLVKRLQDRMDDVTKAVRKWTDML